MIDLHLKLLDPSSMWFFPTFLLITLIIGDNIFLVLGFAYSQGYTEIWSLIAFFWGIVLTDYPFYLIGKSRSFRNLKKIKIIGKLFGRIDDTLRFITWNNITLAFFYCKFISGAKPWINIYLGERKVSTSRFIIMTLIAAVVWSVFAFIVGWLSGAGFTFIWDFFESLSLAVIFLVIITALFLKGIKKAKEYANEKYAKEDEEDI